MYDVVFCLILNGCQMTKHRSAPAAGLLPSQRLIHDDVAWLIESSGAHIWIKVGVDWSINRTDTETDTDTENETDTDTETE